jgi:hypothetical protein
LTWSLLSTLTFGNDEAAVRYEIKRADGKVNEIRIYLGIQKKLLILDHFIDDEAFIKQEQKRFSVEPDADPACANFNKDAKACEKSCYWASKARPFTRATMRSSRGHLLWQWKAKASDTTIGLLTVPPGDDNPQSIVAGECVSPDQKYLTTKGYLSSGHGASSPNNALMGYAVFKLDSTFTKAPVIGKETKEAFGHPRFTGLLGWKKDSPHNLLFEVMRPENNNTAVVDNGNPHP